MEKRAQTRCHKECEQTACQPGSTLQGTGLYSVQKIHILVQLEKTDEQEFEGEAYQPKALLPFMKRVPAKRVVHLPEAARDPVEFSLSFNESLPLPQGISTTQLANFHVTGHIPEHFWQLGRPIQVGGALLLLPWSCPAWLLEN